ncbi:hypothetical protein [Paraburkholderia sp. DGU8]|uniref:hypothetical protein n=1 Tax=Paraburkholderia sp. DGU8 TaxID=3161997 RepID=UPI0034659022
MTKVPDDFPHDVAPAALAGAQPKLAARMIDVQFVVGLTEEERLDRWQICEDLALQLMVPARKDAAKYPQKAHDVVLGRIGDAIVGKDWCNVVEMNWIIARLRELLDGDPSSATGRVSKAGSDSPDIFIHLAAK